MLKIPHQNYSPKRFFPGRLTTQKSYLQQEKKGAINRKALCSSSSKTYKKKTGKSNSLSKSNILVRPNIWENQIDTAHPQILWTTLGKVCRLPGGFDILVKSSCQQTNSGSKNIILRARINNSTQWYRISGLSWCFLKFAFCICSLLWGFHSLCFIVVMVVFMSGVLLFLVAVLIFISFCNWRRDLASRPLGSRQKPQVQSQQIKILIIKMHNNFFSH